MTRQNMLGKQPALLTDSLDELVAGAVAEAEAKYAALRVLPHTRYDLTRVAHLRLHEGARHIIELLDRLVTIHKFDFLVQSIWSGQHMKGKPPILPLNRLTVPLRPSAERPVGCTP